MTLPRALQLIIFKSPVNIAKWGMPWTPKYSLSASLRD